MTRPWVLLGQCVFGSFIGGYEAASVNGSREWMVFAALSVAINGLALLAAEAA